MKGELTEREWEKVDAETEGLYRRFCQQSPYWAFGFFGSGAEAREALGVILSRGERL
jgi:hypothetical protein